MHPARRSFLWLNVVGGLAVLGSYAAAPLLNPAGLDALWGGVPERLRPVYTANMLLAAAGYFAFTHLVFFRLDPATTRVPGGFGYRAFHVLYALVLLPSALWLPLTAAWVASPGEALWWGIRAVLFAVGGGALGILAAVLAQPASRVGALAKWLAVVGALPFCLQTAVLDALVWPAFFAAS